MARQTIAPNIAPGANPTTATVVTITFTACDATNKEQFANTGKEIIHWKNSGVTERTVTLTSVANPRTGRTGDVAFTLAAGAEKILGPIGQVGWQQADSVYTYCEATHADVLIAVVRVP